MLSIPLPSNADAQLRSFADLAFPPCTLADKATYATVQIGPDKHLNLNSDLLYINHSCEPSLVADVHSYL